MKHILKCIRCGAYTMKALTCHGRCLSPKPPKFSIEDRYGRYRRKAKFDDLRKKGLI